jgi:hypothetical protein
LTPCPAHDKKLKVKIEKRKIIFHVLIHFIELFQISLLQTMQSRYAKLEYDNARSLWLNCRHGVGGDGDGEFEYEATFATLVEQVWHFE